MQEDPAARAERHALVASWTAQQGISLVVDTETTGFPNSGGLSLPFGECPDYWLLSRYEPARIVSIAWQLLGPAPAFQRIGDMKHYMVKPNGFTIPADAVDVHGITTQKAMEDGVPLQEALDAFMRDIQGCEVVVAHNTGFDVGLICSELYRLGCEQDAQLVFGKRRFCTMQCGRVVLLRKWAPKLEDIHWGATGRVHLTAHTADGDVDACAAVYIWLQERLAELAAAARAATEARQLPQAPPQPQPLQQPQTPPQPQPQPPPQTPAQPPPQQPHTSPPSRMRPLLPLWTRPRSNSVVVYVELEEGSSCRSVAGADSARASGAEVRIVRMAWRVLSPALALDGATVARPKVFRVLPQGNGLQSGALEQRKQQDGDQTEQDGDTLMGEKEAEAALPINEVLKAFLNAIQDSEVLVTHNAELQLGAIRRELRRLGLREALSDLRARRSLCTMRAGHLAMGLPARHTLVQLLPVLRAQRGEQREGQEENANAQGGGANVDGVAFCYAALFEHIGPAGDALEMES